MIPQSHHPGKSGAQNRIEKSIKEGWITEQAMPEQLKGGSDCSFRCMLSHSSRQRVASEHSTLTLASSLSERKEKQSQPKDMHARAA